MRCTYGLGSVSPVHLDLEVFSGIPLLADLIGMVTNLPMRIPSGSKTKKA